MKAPEFWRTGGLLSQLLAPAGALYALAGRVRRKLAAPYHAPVPVICVGNLTVGGTGKTPTVIDLLQRLQARGIEVHAVSRGYRGSEHGPLRVDMDMHTPVDVGDEPLLLAAFAPTWVSLDRAAGVRAAVEAGAQAIIFDDGHQNPSVGKSLSIVVIDATVGFGNGRVIPAGPLREPIAEGLLRADAALLIGEGSVLLSSFEKPILRATFIPRVSGLDLNGKRVFAFAGIGRPKKFFDMLRDMGAVVADTEAFPDHHIYDARLVERLLARADEQGLTAVTTEKDMVKLPRSVIGKIWPVPILLTYNNVDAVEDLLDRITPRSQL